MNQYKEMENAIINCFVIKPELLKTTKLTTKHFKTHGNLFNLIKSIYDETGTFDMALLYSKCRNKGKAMDYMADIIDTSSISGNYKAYESRLLKLYGEYYAVNEIHKLEQKLYDREIDLDYFIKQIKEMLGDE